MLRPKIVRKNLLRGETRDIICVDSFDDGRTSSLSFFLFYFSSSPLWLLFKRECESIPLSVSIEMRCDLLLLLLLRLANDATVQISFPFIFISLTIEERTALSLIVINLITADRLGWLSWLVAPQLLFSTQTQFALEEYFCRWWWDYSMRTSVQTQERWGQSQWKGWKKERKSLLHLHLVVVVVCVAVIYRFWFSCCCCCWNARAMFNAIQFECCLKAQKNEMTKALHCTASNCTAELSWIKKNGGGRDGTRTYANEEGKKRKERDEVGDEYYRIGMCRSMSVL